MAFLAGRAPNYAARLNTNRRAAQEYGGLHTDIPTIG